MWGSWILIECCLLSFFTIKFFDERERENDESERGGGPERKSSRSPLVGSLLVYQWDVKNALCKKKITVVLNVKLLHG